MNLLLDNSLFLFSRSRSKPIDKSSLFLERLISLYNKQTVCAWLIYPMCFPLLDAR